MLKVIAPINEYNTARTLNNFVLVLGSKARVRSETSIDRPFNFLVPKMGNVVRMVVVSILLSAEFGPNDHRFKARPV